MPSTSHDHTAANDQLKSVKAAWDKAPSGPKKDAAHKHYAAAEAAMKKHDDKTCIAELDKAKKALA